MASISDSRGPSPAPVRVIGIPLVGGAVPDVAGGGLSHGRLGQPVLRTIHASSIGHCLAQSRLANGYRLSSASVGG